MNHLQLKVGSIESAARNLYFLIYSLSFLSSFLSLVSLHKRPTRQTTEASVLTTLLPIQLGETLRCLLWHLDLDLWTPKKKTKQRRRRNRTSFHFLHQETPKQIIHNPNQKFRDEEKSDPASNPRLLCSETFTKCVPRSKNLSRPPLAIADLATACDARKANEPEGRWSPGCHDRRKSERRREKGWSWCSGRGEEEKKGERGDELGSPLSSGREMELPMLGLFLLRRSLTGRSLLITPPF